MPSKRILLARIAFAAYSALMAWELLLGPYRLRLPERLSNLVPFHTLRRAFQNFHRLPLETTLINVAGNVVAFIPLGFLLPLLFPRLRRAHGALGVCFVLILLAESAQYAFRVGVFDVDDILLNLIGCALGYATFAVVNKRK